MSAGYFSDFFPFKVTCHLTSALSAYQTKGFWEARADIELLSQTLYVWRLSLECFVQDVGKRLGGLGKKKKEGSLVFPNDGSSGVFWAAL